jgi:hypothetical protein
MQKPGELDLEMWQGASWDYTLTWTAGGTAIDLTNYTARLKVKEGYDAGTAILSLTTGSGITLGGTAGTIFLEADAATTAGLPARPNSAYIYDLELVSAGTVVTRLVEGKFTVYPEVTD